MVRGPEGPSWGGWIRGGCRRRGSSYRIRVCRVRYRRWLRRPCNAGKPEPRIAKLPGVTSATELVFAVNGQPTCDCTHPINGNDLYVGVVPTPEEPPASRRLGGNPYRLNVGYPCWAVRDATRETLVVQTGGAALDELSRVEWRPDAYRSHRYLTACALAEGGARAITRKPGQVGGVGRWDERPWSMSPGGRTLEAWRSCPTQ